MIILALNCGSSSVKFQLFNWNTQQTLAKGNIERIGSGELANHSEAITKILNDLIADKIINDFTDIKAIGHRVVHGGDHFNCSVIIDEHVLSTIKAVSNLAPLHNPPNIQGIEAATKVLPNVTQVAIFDTAFHQTLPEKTYLYPVPYSWYENFGVRKYGFHGTSHLYITKRAAVLLNKPNDQVNIVSLHIGNGVSFTLVKNGVSIDTSMGLTPLEGAMMGTRSGDIDPAIIPFMVDNLNLDVHEVEKILNKQSGHYGITGGLVDRRDIYNKANQGDGKAKLSLEMEIYRIKKYIGAYVATNPDIEALIFTAGVGENFSFLRQEVLKELEHIGIILDYEKNLQTNSKNGETLISAPNSRIKIYVVPTNEEMVLIEDVVALIEGRYQQHQNYTYSFGRH